MHRLVIERRTAEPSESSANRITDGSLPSWLLRLADKLQLWRERHRQRRSLARLSDHMLKDLGLSRGEVWRESGKNFWER
jgi:uncharacterized protein YjiS (DUF1127 family)